VSDFPLHELITGASRSYSLLSVTFSNDPQDACNVLPQTVALGVEGSVGRWDFRRRAGLSRQDNRSFGSANTGQHIASIFLLSAQPGFDVHVNGAAQNSSCARAA
jgi:ribosomal protein L3